MPKYIDNIEFVEWIIRWRQHHSKRSAYEIGKRFILIAENIIRNPCFMSYTQDRKDEMISDACFTMSKSLPSYDPTFIPNPFSFFTQTVWRSFQQRIKDYKRREAILKPISYIDNIEQQTFQKSTLIKKEMRIKISEPKSCPHRYVDFSNRGTAKCRMCRCILVPTSVGKEIGRDSDGNPIYEELYTVWKEQNK